MGGEEKYDDINLYNMLDKNINFLTFYNILFSLVPLLIYCRSYSYVFVQSIFIAHHPMKLLEASLSGCLLPKCVNLKPAFKERSDVLSSFNNTTVHYFSHNQPLLKE